MQAIKSTPNSRLQPILLFSLGFFIALLFAVYLGLGIVKRISEPQRQLAAYQKVPDFSLIERSGRTVELNDLKGHIWVADFIFTSCPVSCSTLSLRMRELQHALRRNPQVKLVSFTVDPEKDTPEVLRPYADRYMANADQWFFLTGDSQQIYQLAQHGFLLGFVENPKEIQVELGRYSHSTKFALVDQQGVVRAYHDGMSEYVVREIIDDIMILLKSPPSDSALP